MESDDAITVEYTDGDFEILVRPDEAFAYRRGEHKGGFDRILFVQEIFKDAQAAERASAQEIEDEFGTTNIVEAAKKLFENGKMALTTEQRNQMREEKRKQIVSTIARRAKDPQKNAPHPPQRIENALTEAGFHADPMEPAEAQISEAVDLIRPKIPISMEEKEVAIRIPNDHAGECYGIIQQRASKVIDEEWGNDAFMAHIRIPAGVLSELMETLQKKTSGEAEVTDV